MSSEVLKSSQNVNILYKIWTVLPGGRKEQTGDTGIAD